MLRADRAGQPAARGGYAALHPVKVEAFADALDPYAAAAAYLSDTLDWLNLWQDNANNDQWREEDFSAKQDHYFPQP